jgi:SNF2 family DNA or RNA helicase
MTSTGETLTAAGFDIRVPALSRRKPTPSLRLTSEEAQESVVGAQQLANVSWSAVFDDVELTAEEIAGLAAQAKPLVRSRGQWVELDRADLAQAAAALADRAGATQLTGAEMLRHALGLEGSPLAGGISITGDGWAAELLRSASDIPGDLQTRPDGFVGELRSYQAEARAWLSFLDRAGLGGCLALDMGLGKTPTLLAHLKQTSGEGPALVIAPPAVVGNWAAEAERFVPELSVHIHHGSSRADLDDVPSMAAKTDVVLTTYGTAVRDIESLEKVAWSTVVLDEAQAIKNPSSETAQQLRRLEARTRVALTGTPIENGLGDLWSIMDFTNPGLVGPRAPFVAQLSQTNDGEGGAESALRALNGILVFRRTKAEPAIAAELPDRIDELDHCTMTPEQIGLYQAVLDRLIAVTTSDDDTPKNKGAVLAAITALKQVCNHPAAYEADDKPLDGRSGKLTRLDEIVDSVFASGERVLIFTHFASWGEKLATYLSDRTGIPIACYHGGLARGARDKLVSEFQAGEGAGAMVLSLKAGGTGLNLTAASHVVLYDRWWNPAVEDQARDRVWRIGQTNTVICHRLVCPGTVDERVEEVVAGKRKIADLVLPKSSSIDDLDAQQLQIALGIDADTVLAEDPDDVEAGAAA